jgi:hypothetical protein
MRRFIKDLSGGLNLSRPPHLIQDNQLSVATDCVYRSGKWQKRDGYANLRWWGVRGGKNVMAMQT